MSRRPALRRWLKMGVELEGAWDTDYRTVATKCTGAQGKGDSSVKGLTGPSGEITTRPHTILDHLCNDVIEMYPARVNETCGFHIHASFNHMDYSMLADTPFWDYYRARWQTWGKANQDTMGTISRREFWDRWFGRGERAKRFCKAEFKPVEQWINHEDRYTQLNFTAYHKYQTLESRLLPMFETSELAVSAIREMSDIFDTFLNDNQFPHLKFSTEFKMEGEVAVEHKEMPMPNTAYWEEEAHENPMKALAVGEDVYYNLRGAQDMMLPFTERVMAEEP
jgi:hypothetical protein